MKLKGHTDNVRAVLLNEDGSEVRLVLTDQVSFFFLSPLSVFLLVQMVRSVSGPSVNSAVWKPSGYMRVESGY